MTFEKLIEYFPKAGFVKIAPFEDEELNDENLRKKNKAPLNSIKDPLTSAQALNWISRGGRIGWIIPKGYICIDVDNKDHEKSSQVIEDLLEARSLLYLSNYSRQGTHFIFANVSDIMKGKGQFQGYINHIGVQCDGRADNKGYIILPINDEESGRSWGKWDNPDIDDLPFWLRPLRVRKDKDVSFIDMEEGAGNEALFKLRAAMSVPNLVTEEESIECLRIINNEIWADPMPENIFSATVARPVERTYGNMQSIDGTGNDKPKSWLPVAQKLIAEQDLIAVGDFIYKRNNGVYEKLTSYEVHEMIHRHGNLEATFSNRKEVLEFICVQKQISPSLLNQEYACIPCENGYLDLWNLQLVEPKADDYNTIRTKVAFNPNCHFSERIDDFMKFISSGDPNVITQLYEIAGYCLVRRNNFHKFFVLVGGGGTGKSTFCNLIRRMFHAKNVTTVALSQFDQDYHLATLIDSMVNIDDDASSEKVLKDAGRFKSITAGMPVLVRPIYSDPLELTCTATIIVCANSMPKIHDSSEGLYRRLMLVELNNRVKNPDRDFENKITDLDMEYFFYKAAEAIHRVLKNGRFTNEESEDVLKQKFRVQQSSINKWCQLEFITVETLLNRGMKSVYTEYKLWCLECGYGAFNYGNFVDSITKQYKISTQYDRALKDQIIISSLLPLTFCPFDQSLKSDYN